MDITNYFNDKVLVLDILTVILKFDKDRHFFGGKKIVEKCAQFFKIDKNLLSTGEVC